MQVRIADHPQLARICWSLTGADTLSGERALAMYEANWKHVDEAALDRTERDLIDALVREFGGGTLCV